jgi:hypothetical protein
MYIPYIQHTCNRYIIDHWKIVDILTGGVGEYCMGFRLPAVIRLL